MLILPISMYFFLQRRLSFPNTLSLLHRCTKSLSLAKLPEVLVLTLKRFGRQLRADARFLPDKLQDPVDFPLDGLDLAPFMMDHPDRGGGGGGGGGGGSAAAAAAAAPAAAASVVGPESTLYDCFGVVNHYGHVNFGHYKAFVRGGEWHETGSSGSGGSRSTEAVGGAASTTSVLPDSWFEFDDDLVRPMKTGGVVSQVRRGVGARTFDAADVCCLLSLLSAGVGCSYPFSLFTFQCFQAAYVLFYRRRNTGVGGSRL
jgi:hypothetical protein